MAGEIIHPSSVQRACRELRDNGQVPMLLATSHENYMATRIAYNLGPDDVLIVANVLVADVAWALQAPAQFVMCSVDSELKQE